MPGPNLSLYEFVALRLEDRAVAVTERGVHLLNVEGPKGLSIFFGLGDYWVELVMKDPGGVVEVVAFRKGDRLDRLVAALPDLPSEW
jgi:hypothetical protein